MVTLDLFDVLIILNREIIGNQIIQDWNNILLVFTSRIKSLSSRLK